jgi:hypothetical protein
MANAAEKNQKDQKDLKTGDKHNSQMPERESGREGSNREKDIKEKDKQGEKRTPVANKQK